MSEMFVLKPAPGRLVRDPFTLAKLAPEGEPKPQDSYWLRRVKAGDAIVVEPSTSKAPKAAKE